MTWWTFTPTSKTLFEILLTLHIRSSACRWKGKIMLYEYFKFELDCHQNKVYKSIILLFWQQKRVKIGLKWALAGLAALGVNVWRFKLMCLPIVRCLCPGITTHFREAPPNTWLSSSSTTWTILFAPPANQKPWMIHMDQSKTNPTIWGILPLQPF